MNVFAEVGASLQQIGGDCPVGWIVMQGERPSPEHVVQEDGSWIIPPTPVPESVTMRQARLAMLQAGILDDIEVVISTMSGVEGQAARIEWEYALDIRRNNPLVSLIWDSLGLSESELDEIFIAANLI